MSVRPVKRSSNTMLIAWILRGLFCYILVRVEDVTGTQRTTNSHDPYDAHQIEREDDPVCRPEWHPFGNMCYKIIGKAMPERMSWENASITCHGYGGELATIHSKALQDYVTAFLLLNAQTSVWIGLHDRGNESSYEWADGSEVNYTNWAPMEPSGYNDLTEDCVELMIYSPQTDTGMWNDVNCDYKKPFMCQLNKDTFDKVTQDPRLCPSSTGVGWKLNKSCYYVVTTKKTWTEAEGHCSMNYQGHLVAVTDFTVRVYLQYLLRGNNTNGLWIGIKFGKIPLKWSSGWIVYNVDSFWADGEPDNVSENHCASLTENGLWKVDQCERRLAFICETSSLKPPVLPLPAIEGSRCPESPKGWRDLGGEYCYFIETANYMSWYRASFLCMRRGGALVSIHSKAEVETLEQFFKYTHFVIHIGLYRKMENVSEFAWTDGTEVDFYFWDANEPNSKYELCTEFRADTMKWNDIHCLERRGYICSVKKIPPNNTEVQSYSSCQCVYSPTVIAGLILCVVLVTSSLCFVLHRFRPYPLPKRPRYISWIDLRPSTLDQHVGSPEILIGDGAEGGNFRT